MVRIQVQLTDEQLERLRQISSETGRSVADLVREGMSEYLNRRSRPTNAERRARALSAIGRFHSGKSDGSRDHDRLVAEAFSK